MIRSLAEPRHRPDFRAYWAGAGLGATSSRRGSDIAAALALGAKAVLIGRAHLYGLAAAGEAGVRHCIDILASELRMTMQLCGARTIAELDRGLIRRRQLQASTLEPAAPQPAATVRPRTRQSAPRRPARSS